MGLRLNLENSLKFWIEMVLSKPNPLLGDVPPCPYAREAFLKNKIAFYETSAENVFSIVEQTLQQFPLSPNIEIAIIAIENGSACPPPQVSAFVHQMRERYFSRDLWLLYDHPDIRESVEEFTFNHGKFLLFMVQKLSRLVSASDDLTQLGYYQKWSKEYYQEVVLLRKQYLQRLKTGQATDHGLQT